MGTGGVDQNTWSGAQTGAESFESIGGNGFNFFFYVVDNPNNSNNTVGTHATYGASGLADDFPFGLTEEPVIRPLVVGERGSTIYGDLTEDAPNALEILSWDADSFRLGWSNPGATVGSDARAGWEIIVQPSENSPIPEPSSLIGLCGLFSVGFCMRRRA